MKLRAVVVTAILTTSAFALAGDWSSFGSNHGVHVAWKNHGQSDGSGGTYYEQLLRIENTNTFAVEVRYEVTLECADGSNGSGVWQGTDTLGPGSVHSGELAGLWSRNCAGHGEDGRALGAVLRSRVSQP